MAQDEEKHLDQNNNTPRLRLSTLTEIVATETGVRLTAGPSSMSIGDLPLWIR